MCEGPNELKIIELLLDNHKLKFTRDDLLDLRPFHARKLESAHLKPVLEAYHSDIIIYRIGDKISDKLTIPKNFCCNILEEKKFCTKPELEMLLIFAEGKEKEYEKNKSTEKPKVFCKKCIKYNNRKYDNSTEFYNLYFKNRIDLLINSIIKYKEKNHSHKKNEGYLFDLLK